MTNATLTDGPRMTNPEQREKIARAVYAVKPIRLVNREEPLTFDEARADGMWYQPAEAYRIADAIIALDPAPESVMIDQFTGDEGIATEHAQALAQPNPLDTPRPAPDVERIADALVTVERAEHSLPPVKFGMLSDADQERYRNRARAVAATLARSSGS